QEDSLLKDARFHVRMADGAEENRRELPQFLDDAVGQGFLGAEIPLAAEVVGSEVEFERELFGGDFQNLDGFAGDFRPGAVAADDCDVVAFHESVGSVCPPRAGSGDANGSVVPGNGIFRQRLRQGCMTKTFTQWALLGFSHKEYPATVLLLLAFSAFVSFDSPQPPNRLNHPVGETREH